jgi:electron transfer flavoprotein beta subunit
MKILVAVKRVIDHNVRLRVKPDGSGVETAGVRMSMNPFCKNAMEEAARLKQAGAATEIVAVSIGPKQANDVLLTALAIGADRALLIETDERIETLGVAKLLKAVVDEEKPDLVFLGKQAVDGDNNHTGQMLAGLLGWPQACFASAVAVEGDKIRVTSEVDYGRSEHLMPLPAVVTADLRLNTPRNTALPAVMAARKKPLATRPAAEFGIDLTPRLRIETVDPPPARPEGKPVASLDELVATVRKLGTEVEAGQ